MLRPWFFGAVGVDVYCGEKRGPPRCLRPAKHVSRRDAAADTFLNEAFARSCSQIGNRFAARALGAAKTPQRQGGRHDAVEVAPSEWPTAGGRRCGAAAGSLLESANAGSRIGR